MSDNDFFAPPRFNPDEALQRLKRDLRALGLTERAGLFERRGSAIAKAALDGGDIAAARVRRPVRSSPEWQVKRIKTNADLRDFVFDLKRALAQWGDQDD